MNNNQNQTNPNNPQNQNTKKPMIYAIVGSSDFNKNHFLGNFNNGMFTRIIAVDGGYKYLDELGIVPNAVVGDFDSLGYVPQGGATPSAIKYEIEPVVDPALEEMQVLQYPMNKDKTDFELAVDEALSNKPQVIMCYGVLGQRMDHEFSAIQVMSHCSDHRVGIFAVGNKQSCIVINGPAEFGLGARLGDDVDRTISVFSLTDVSGGIESRGLKWPYVNTPLTNAMSLGVSNEITEKEMKIKVKQGKLLIVFSTELLTPNADKQ